MEAFAQAAAPSGSADPRISMLLNFLQFVPIFVLIYFLLIRPQQKKQKETEKMLANLKKGDRVLTSGGIFGTVIGLDDHKAVIKIADETKVEFSKNAIVSVVATEAKA